ncbi:hypothetical protein [Burkholderia latens]|nr:hypothetical protein [Burkholderia latens]
MAIVLATCGGHSAFYPTRLPDLLSVQDEEATRSNHANAEQSEQLGILIEHQLSQQHGPDQMRLGEGCGCNGAHLFEHPDQEKIAHASG